ncbi:MAG: MarR family transcriptional regulator [Candidatus Aenigmarchaeota archaeon]|nr:MarR family transcriptional regulator [Candidatus Aenigmarchaeota archaeon]
MEDKYRERLFCGIIKIFKFQTTFAEYLSNKARIRKMKPTKIMRETVKGWRKGKHVSGWKIYIPYWVIEEISNILIESGFDEFKLDEINRHIIAYNPLTANPMLRNKLVFNIQGNLSGKKNEKDIIDMLALLPSHLLPSRRARKQHPIFVEFSNKNLRVWSQACWKKSETRLKRYVKLDQVFWIGCALYFGEGYTKVSEKSDNSKISLGNSEPILVKKFLEWLEGILDEKPKLSFYLEHNERKSKNKQECLKFWSDWLTLDKKCIGIRTISNSGSRLQENYGLMGVYLTNTVLRSVIKSLLEESKKIVLTKRKWCIDWLKGLIAGEGSVYIKNKSIVSVSIGSIRPMDREFIKRLLERLVIKYREGVNDICIFGWDEFYKLHLLDAFEIPQLTNESKKIKFLRGFLNHQKTKTLMKMKYFENKEFTVRDWSEKFHVHKQVVHRQLDRLVKKDFLIQSRGGIDNRGIINDTMKRFRINLDKKDMLIKIWGLSRELKMAKNLKEKLKKFRNVDSVNFIS